ncbi:Na+/Pi symporter [Cladophialophora chaetospira]|uniref:Phosphate transporter n=1 Tax=Cladophialophora chaetospira TaxID=386627 RepID=A0AA39CN45_9EURO|nr:Na+/Pi symporter [Cladophialophora chaetospira]
MAALPQYDYIFAFGMIFSFLDAWNIGANDVANSFATSVSSRSLTMMQAMAIATVCEFGGAVLAGARVSSTIKNSVISVNDFEVNPSVLMLGMLCALVGSSLWLTVSTKIGLPVSTTHSIVGGLIGVGIAALGGSGVNWSWKGVSQIFAAWFIAPGISAGFASIIFLITKYGVLKRSRPLIAGLWMIPLYFGVTAGVLTMVIVWKGAASLGGLDEWNTAQTVGTIFGVAGGVVLLYAVFLLPFLYRRLVMDDWTLKSWEVIKGPLLWRRGEVPPQPEGEQKEIIQDYYRGHSSGAELQPALANNVPLQTDTAGDVEKRTSVMNDPDAAISSTSNSNKEVVAPSRPLSQSAKAKLESLEYPWKTPRGFYARCKYYFFRGVTRDIVAEQMDTGEAQKGFAAKFLAKDLPNIHKHVEHYDNKTEHLYSFLQVMTAMTASFAHGANDVSNAVGPLSAIYAVWQTGETASRSSVPIWILAYGGAAISIGLWMYGYNLMRNLGNRLTLHSPSRGFCMELGAALTVVLATRLALPISTTQCITGATVGVGLCSGTWRAINWRMIAWIYFGWLLTLPIAGIVSGGLMGIIINAPRWGLIPELPT